MLLSLHQVPFNQHHATTSLESSRTYDSSANLFWLKLTHLPQPGVPINEASVKSIMLTKFATPQILLDRFIVRVSPGTNGQQIMRSIGALEILSPPELLHALILRLAEVLSGDPDESEVLEWRKVVLSVTFIFEYIGTSEDAYWRAINLREQTVNDFETLARDVSQRVMELVAYKQLMFKVKNQDLNNKALAQAWKDHVIQCDSRFSERVTENYVDTAMKVWNRLFKPCPQSLEVIMEDSDSHGAAHTVLRKYRANTVLSGGGVLCKYPFMLFVC